MAGAGAQGALFNQRGGWSGHPLKPFPRPGANHKQHHKELFLPHPLGSATGELQLASVATSRSHREVVNTKDRTTAEKQEEATEKRSGECARAGNDTGGGPPNRIVQGS